MRCDCHVHVVGPSDQYPQVPKRIFLAAPAPLDELRRVAAARGVSRFVVVQPSFYGTDNRATLDSLDQLGGEGRGVAVIDPAWAPSDLADWHARGVRGLRINLYSPVSAPHVGSVQDAYAALAAIAQPRGWHLQVIAPLDVLTRYAPLIGRTRVPVVVDHYGLYGGATPDSRVGAELLALLALPHVWIKLSAPYRVSADPLQTRPDPAWLAAILRVAGDRCVWGSDWPYTAPHGDARGPDVALPYRNLSYAQLVDDFVAAVPPAMVQRILVDNPTRLYGF